MTTIERDKVGVAGEGEAVTGSNRLKLSVTRMKKLHAGVKGGPQQGTAPKSWALSFDFLRAIVSNARCGSRVVGCCPPV